MRRSGTVLVLLGLILSSGLLVPGCDEGSTSPNCPCYQVGALEGYVRGGGIPAQAQVRAIPEGEWNDRRFQARTDSTGWYRMELPTGKYRISLLPPEETGSVFYAGMDTVTVLPTVRRYDQNEGSVRVRVTVPSFFEGRQMTCTLDGVVLSPSARATAHNRVLEWTFPLVYPGTARVHLRVDRADLWWLPGTRDSHQAQLFSIGPSAPTEIQADLSGFTELAGNVHGSWEAMDLVPPGIVALGADSTVVAEFRPGTDGAFTLDVFPPQPVRIGLARPYDGVSLWVGGDSYQTATVFNLEAGRRTEGIEVRECGILCSLDRPDSIDVSGVRVRLVDAAGRESTPYAYQLYGKFGITGLSPGRYFLRLEHDCDEPWAPVWFGGAESQAEATAIEINTPGETVEIAMQIVPGGRIEGTVLPRAGGAHSLQKVRLFDAVGNLVCERYSGETTGAFSFQGLDNGVYRVSVGWLPGPGWWYPGTTDADSAGAITVTEHGAVSGIDWRLP